MSEGGATPFHMLPRVLFLASTKIMKNNLFWSHLEGRSTNRDMRFGFLYYNGEIATVRMISRVGNAAAIICMVAQWLHGLYLLCFSGNLANPIFTFKEWEHLHGLFGTQSLSVLPFKIVALLSELGARFRHWNKVCTSQAPLPPCQLNSHTKYYMKQG